MGGFLLFICYHLLLAIYMIGTDYVNFNYQGILKFVQKLLFGILSWDYLNIVYYNDSNIDSD